MASPPDRASSAFLDLFEILVFVLRFHCFLRFRAYRPRALSEAMASNTVAASGTTNPGLVGGTRSVYKVSVSLALPSTATTT